MARLTGIIAPHATSLVKTASSSQAPAIPVGTRARDVDGNEYVYVDFQEAFAKGEICAISSAFLASKCAATTVGPIGVVCGTVASSDLGGWAQVYGTCTFILHSTATSVGPVMVDATTDGYSVIANIDVANPRTTAQIVGLYLSSSGSSGSSGTTAYDGSTIMALSTVQLNYPYVSGGIAGVTSGTT